MAKPKKRKDSNGRALRKGEGQRDNGLYYYRWIDDAGNRHYVYGTSLDELRRKEDAITLDVLTGTPPEASKMTLNDAVEAWRQLRMQDVSIGALKLTTVNQYLNAYNKHARAPLGNLKIKDINKAKLEAFYVEKMAQGLGYSQIANVAKPVNQAFALAEESGWIRRSPTKGTLKKVATADKRRRNREAKPPKALTEEEQTALVKWLSSEDDRIPLKCIVTTLLYTGLRIGELAALQEEDVTDSHLTVRNSFAYFGADLGEGWKMVRRMQEPKSRAGFRTIPLLEPASKAISEFREWKQLHGVSLIEPIDGYSNFVFLTRDGWPLTPSSVNYALLRAVNCINKEAASSGEDPSFPRISCHWLRRTFATRLCEAGVSMKVAQHILGHEDINLTSRIYVSVQDGYMGSEISKVAGKQVDAPTGMVPKYTKSTPNQSQNGASESQSPA